MKLSNKQKDALEKITGKPCDSWHPDAVRAYFAFTDKGDDSFVGELLGDTWQSWSKPIWEGGANEAQKDLFEIIVAHKFHAYTVECWKEDFRKGLLFLDDFLNHDYPQVYIKHAMEIIKHYVKEKNGILH